MSRLPNLRPRQVVAALRKAGFLEHHQKGSHLYLWNAQTKRMTCVPIHPGDVDRRQAGLSEDHFRELL